MTGRLDVHGRSLLAVKGRSTWRSGRLDALRGLAVLLMVTDHVALFAGLDVVRATAGRLALPVFFVLAGHLACRLSSRLLLVLAAGVALPVLAPWVDSPNVLVWMVAGALLLAGCRRFSVSPVLLLVVCLTLLANQWLADGPGTSYSPPALVAMMAAGSGLSRESFAWAAHLPAWLVPVGRYALVLYVGHVLFLTAVLT